jgi:hypothetical protein
MEDTQVSMAKSLIKRDIVETTLAYLFGDHSETRRLASSGLQQADNYYWLELD